MEARKYYAILTAAGENALANAALTGQPVGFTSMAVGDGDILVSPDPEQTGLINEVYRAPLNRVVIADQAANVIRAEMVMQPQTGGFWLREAALYDDEGICLAVASLPPSYKPLLESGAGRLQAINLWVAVTNTVDVKLSADPTVIMASAQDVARASDDAKDYTDEVVGQLDTDFKKAIADAVKTAVRDAWEEDNPPGTTRFFNQNLNPNERWPWSEWVYTGENKAIRVGKADGSDVGQTGGSDTVTLQRTNLPAVQIDVSGETSEQEEQTLTTEENGEHFHKGGHGAPGTKWVDVTIGTDNQKSTTYNNTSTEPAHSHDVTIPPHKHSTSGKTDNLGEGKSFSVVEAHTLLMCWSRVA